jgi:hypothetical protein
VAKDALTSLVNLSGDEKNVMRMLGKLQRSLVYTQLICNRGVSYSENNGHFQGYFFVILHLLIITQKHKASDPLVELGGMLLCNLTTHEIGCKTLVGENDVVKQVAFHTLLEFFVFNEERGDSDYYAWIASVLVNISRVCISFHLFVFCILKI